MELSTQDIHMKQEEGLAKCGQLGTKEGRFCCMWTSATWSHSRKLHSCQYSVRCSYWATSMQHYIGVT